MREPTHAHAGHCKMARSGWAGRRTLSCESDLQHSVHWAFNSAGGTSKTNNDAHYVCKCLPKAMANKAYRCPPRTLTVRRTRSSAMQERSPALCIYAGRASLRMRIEAIPLPSQPAAMTLHGAFLQSGVQDSDERMQCDKVKCGEKRILGTAADWPETNPPLSGGPYLLRSAIARVMDNTACNNSERDCCHGLVSGIV